MKQKKSENLFYKFGSTVLKTLGVCLGAYLILCVVNAYAPKKPEYKFNLSHSNNRQAPGSGPKKASVQFILEPATEFKTDF